MKKIFMALMLCFVSIVGFGQWTVRNINNEFGEKYIVAYTETNNYMFLKIESFIGYPYLLIYGGYFCDDVAYIDISFFRNNQWHPYKIRGEKSSDSNYYILDYKDTFWQEDFLQDFLNSTKCKIRIRQDYCNMKISEFSMTGSTKAINTFFNSKEYVNRRKIDELTQHIQDSINNELSCSKKRNTIVEMLPGNEFIMESGDTIFYKSVVDINLNKVDKMQRRFFVSNNDSTYQEVLSGKIYNYIYVFDSKYGHLITIN